MFWYILVSAGVGVIVGVIIGVLFASKNPDDIKKVGEVVSKVKEKVK